MVKGRGQAFKFGGMLYSKSRSYFTYPEGEGKKNLSLLKF